MECSFLQKIAWDTHVLQGIDNESPGLLQAGKVMTCLSGQLCICVKRRKEQPQPVVKKAQQRKGDTVLSSLTLLTLCIR